MLAGRDNKRLSITTAVNTGLHAHFAPVRHRDSVKYLDDLDFTPRLHENNSQRGRKNSQQPHRNSLYPSSHIENKRRHSSSNSTTHGRSKSISLQPNDTQNLSKNSGRRPSENTELNKYATTPPTLNARKLTSASTQFQRQVRDFLALRESSKGYLAAKEMKQELILRQIESVLDSDDDEETAEDDRIKEEDEEDEDINISSFRNKYDTDSKSRQKQDFTYSQKMNDNLSVGGPSENLSRRNSESGMKNLDVTFSIQPSVRRGSNTFDGPENANQFNSGGLIAANESKDFTSQRKNSLIVNHDARRGSFTGAGNISRDNSRRGSGVDTSEAQMFREKSFSDLFWGEKTEENEKQQESKEEKTGDNIIYINKMPVITIPLNTFAVGDIHNTSASDNVGMQNNSTSPVVESNEIVSKLSDIPQVNVVDSLNDSNSTKNMEETAIFSAELKSKSTADISKKNLEDCNDKSINDLCSVSKTVDNNQETNPKKERKQSKSEVSILKLRDPVDLHTFSKFDLPKFPGEKSMSEKAAAGQELDNISLKTNSESQKTISNLPKTPASTMVNKRSYISGRRNTLASLPSTTPTNFNNQSPLPLRRGSNDLLSPFSKLNPNRKLSVQHERTEESQPDISASSQNIDNITLPPLSTYDPFKNPENETELPFPELPQPMSFDSNRRQSIARKAIDPFGMTFMTEQPLDTPIEKVEGVVIVGKRRTSLSEMAFYNPPVAPAPKENIFTRRNSLSVVMSASIPSEPPPSEVCIPTSTVETESIARSMSAQDEEKLKRMAKLRDALLLSLSKKKSKQTISDVVMAALAKSRLKQSLNSRDDSYDGDTTVTRRAESVGRRTDSVGDKSAIRDEISTVVDSTMSESMTDRAKKLNKLKNVLLIAVSKKKGKQSIGDVVLAALARSRLSKKREATTTFLTDLFLEESMRVAEEHVTAKTYGTSPAFKRLRRFVRMIAISSHFTKFLSRILKNPVQWGWEYDPDAILFRIGGGYDDDGNVKKKISAVDFGVMKLFNTQKVFKGWLNDAMRSLFRKSPHERTELDLMELQNWCSGMKAFSKYQNIIQKRLLKVGRYERWHSGRLIVREGHKAMNFYIILDGEIEVYRTDQVKLKESYYAAHSHNGNGSSSTAKLDEVKEEEEGEDNNDNSDEAQNNGSSEDIVKESNSNVGDHTRASIESFNSSTGTSSSLSNSNSSISTSSTSSSSNTTPSEPLNKKIESIDSTNKKNVMTAGEIELLKRKQSSAMADYERAYRITLGTQSSGDSFGELAFSNNGLRMASVATKRTTEFLVISREDYENIMLTAQTSDVAEKMSVMNNLPILKTLGNLDSLAYYCDVQTYPPNSLLVCEGEICEYVYFISSGKCRMVKAIHFAKVPVQKERFKLVPLSQSEPIPEHLEPFPIQTKFIFAEEILPGDHFFDGKVYSSARDIIMQSGLVSTPARTSVVTTLKTEVLRITKLDFNKFATKLTWKSYAEHVDRTLPREDHLVEEFVKNHEWEICKRKIIEETISRIKANKPAITVGV